MAANSLLRKPVLMLVAPLAATLASPEAFAQDHGDLSRQLIQTFDDNGDGLIDPSEVERQKAELFSALDDDGDGSVSRDEFMRGESLLFAEFDLNRDGLITPDEIKAAQTTSKEPISFMPTTKAATPSDDHRDADI